MVKHRFIILILFLIIGCQPKTLTNDALIQKKFTTADVKTMEEILYFFDSQVMNNCESNLLEECYNNFFSRIELHMFNDDSLAVGIDKNKQLEFISNIDSSTFNKIWEYGWTTRGKNLTKESFCQLGYKYKGAYINYLKENANSHELIKSYYNTYEIAGDISPKMIGDVIINYSQIDVASEQERLFLAIHYLTLNHPLIKKVDNSICKTPTFAEE